MRMTISRSKAWTALAVGAFVAPTVLGAQDTTSKQPAVPAAQQQPQATRSHTVKAGDTLWDLARTYLGDPFLWPEIYRLNTDVVEDPHWIYPGERLHIPGAGAAGAPTVVAGEAEPSRFGPTTFSRGMTRGGGESSGRLSLVGRTPRPLVRTGEYYAAPYVEREGGPAGAGKIVASSDMPGIAQISSVDRIQMQDAVLITPPAGSEPVDGARYLSFTLGDYLPGVGQIVIPTGVVQVEGETRTGELTRARVVKAYSTMLMGQGLIRIDSVSFPGDVKPAPIELGMDAKVVWLYGRNVLPSIHSYLVLDKTSRDGVHPGDQFTLYRPRTRLETGQVMPAEPIAIAQVIRVTPFATTALILDQAQPAIREGVTARMTAKVQ